MRTRGFHGDEYTHVIMGYSAKSYRFARLSLAVMAFLATLVASAVEAHASTTLFTTSKSRLLAKLTDGATSLPVMLRSDKDVYVLVYGGSCYTDVLVLGRPGVAPGRLATAISPATVAGPAEKRTVETAAEQYSVAQVHTEPVSRQIAGTHTRRIDVGLIAVALRKSGYVPHVALGVPLHATATGLGKPRFVTKQFRWWDERDVARVPVVTVSAKLGGLEWGVIVGSAAIAVLAMLGVPVSLFLQRRRIERDGIDATQALLRSLTVVLALFVAFIPIVTLVTGSRHACMVDIFLHSPLTSRIIFLTICSMGCFGAIAAVASLYVRRKYLPPSVKPPAAPHLERMTPEEAKVRSRQHSVAAVSHVVPIIGALLSVGLLPALFGKHTRSVLELTLVAIILVGTFVISRTLARFRNTFVDDELTWRAREIGSLMRRRFRNVLIEDSSEASCYATIKTKGQDICISRKLKEVANESELDFLFAREMLADNKGQYLVLVALGLILVLAAYGVSLTRSTVVLLGVVGAFLAVNLVIVVWSARRRSRITLKVFPADKRAIETLASPQYAISALMLLVRYAPPSPVALSVIVRRLIAIKHEFPEVSLSGLVVPDYVAGTLDLPTRRELAKVEVYTPETTQLAATTPDQPA
ncbi:MAG TPA: hypothetical protein VGK19_05605 [Capsulimonadaceae bacterium]